MKIHTRVEYQFNPETDSYELVQDEWFEYSGPVAEVKGGSGGSTTTVQQADPWTGQQPYLKDKFAEAQRLYKSPGPAYFPGATLAGQTQPQLQGQQMALAGANNMMPTLEAANRGAAYLSSPDILSPNSNPWLKATADAAARPVLQAYNEQLLPSIRQDAIAAGNLGNDRQGVAEGIASRAAMDTIADQSAQIYSDAYGQGLESMARGLTLAPSVAQSQLLPGSVYSGVGAEQQAWQQALIDAEIDRWNYNQGLPWQQLSNYDAMISGNFGGVQNTSQTGKQSGLTSAMMGGLGGAAMGSLVPGLGGSLLTGGGGALLGPAGWAGMAAGALMGLYG